MSPYWHKCLNEREETALSHRRIPLIKIKERNFMSPLRKHPVIIVTVKIHSWTLKLACKRLRRKRVHAYSQTMSPKLLTNYKGQNSNFTVEKTSRHHFNPVTEVSIIYNKTCWHQAPPGMMLGVRHNITSLVFLPNIRNLIENIRPSLIEGRPTKHLSSILRKCQGHER